jgi:hypothetical protein
MLQQHSGLIAITSLVLAVMMSALAFSSLGGIEGKINTIKNQVEKDINILISKIDNINTSINTNMSSYSQTITSMTTSIGSLQSEVNTLKTNVASIQTTVTGLGSSTTLLNSAINNITKLSSMITNLSNQIQPEGNTTTSIEIPRGNSSNPTECTSVIYLNVTHTGSSITELKVRLQCDKVNFSNVTWNTESIPEMYSYLHDGIYDNVRLDWLGIEKSTVRVRVNISWNILDYPPAINSSSFSKALMVNGKPVEV